MKYKQLFLLAISFFINHVNLQIHAKYFLTLKWVKDSSFSLTQDFLSELSKTLNIDVFIETGTFLGGTTLNAAPYFNQIHTIELSRDLFEKANQRLKNYKNVHVYHGDSSAILYKILPSIHGKILFWLDGHFSEGSTAKGQTNTPIIEELLAIKNCQIKDAIILIDDIRCFKEFGYTPTRFSLNDYPSLQEIQKLVLEINEHYRFEILGDTAIAFLDSEQIEVSPVFHACTISRLYDDQTSNLSLDELAANEQIIATAQGEEKNAIEKLYLTFTQHDENNLGIYYSLWRGLIHLKNNQSILKYELEKFSKLLPASRQIKYYASLLIK